MCPEIRIAGMPDLEAIARVHSESWRSTYRGLIADSLLDQDLLGNRRTLWSQRLADPAAGRYTWLASVDGQPVAVSSLLLDADPVHGSLIDALHVQDGFKGRGIGSALSLVLARKARELRAQQPLHLWVLDGNWRAARFYEGLGAIHLGMRYDDHLPGAESYDHRYGWPSPKHLIDRLSSRSPEGAGPATS
ncbi:MAG: N-acetyltransferase family protein [Lysobacterales bacterium]